MENIVAIIPARMASSRFPGKPMAPIHGIPMIGHVYLRTQMCKKLAGTYVATCDQEIFQYISDIGGKAIMTADTHERCSDRTAEALKTIERDSGKKVDIVVMVQGDEPMVYPEMIEAAVNPLIEDANVSVVNLMAPLKSVKEHEDPNEVKVVIDQKDFALYFSREPIPSRKKGVDKVPMFKQVCIMPFRRDALIQFSMLPPTPLEIIESVDMLRLLENGFSVKMVRTDKVTYSVDTPDDLQQVEVLMESDMLLNAYANVRSMK
jgi:3-deoxy-manno-octulosonate cytidylyltransferase (CMP-KDO synthetase)